MLAPVTHPGPVAVQRITTAEGTMRSARTRLNGAHTAGFADALVQAVESMGSRYGCVEIGSGTLAHLDYCYPAAGDERHPMLYSETRTAANAQVVCGSATIGLRPRPSPAKQQASAIEAPHTDFEPWAHVHLLWTEPEGALRAGHIWPTSRLTANIPGGTAAGVPAGTPEVIVHAFSGIELVNALDPETELPVFTGTRSGPTAPGRRVVFARIAPNVELHSAIAEVCSRHGITRARPLAGTGSLVGATFSDRFTTQTVEVSGPAVEVITLRGSVDLTSEQPQISLDATLADARGAVHAGRLASTGNLVGATYDLVLEVI